MERGLLWLPLLAFFIWLAWAGWNEYRKLEAYQTWASDFERAKYDILAVLGERQGVLTWGQPTRQGPVNLQSLALDSVQAVRLVVNQQAVDPSDPPRRGQAAIALEQPTTTVEIPFTDVALAAQWATYLQGALADAASAEG